MKDDWSWSSPGLDEPAPPTVSISYTIRNGVSLTDTVRKAEDAVSILGALYIVDCLLTGSDQNGWNVTVNAVSR